MIPVQDITKNQSSFSVILFLVILTVIIVYIVFGFYCVLSWGNTITTPLITDKLPEGLVVNFVLILFAVNLVFSFPLVIHPAHIIVENYIYKTWKKSKKR